VPPKLEFDDMPGFKPETVCFFESHRQDAGATTGLKLGGGFSNLPVRVEGGARKSQSNFYKL
jgi:hypothetical protein